jgi:hypothetical protein
MSQLALVYPLLCQIALTLGLLLWMMRARYNALTSRQVRLGDIALGQPAWPAQTTQVSNCFRNQFELPVLFYVLVLLVLITRISDVVLVVLAWAFVITRFAHAYIHTGRNDVRMRGTVYAVGAMILLVAWAWYAVRFLSAAAG